MERRYPCRRTPDQQYPETGADELHVRNYKSALLLLIRSRRQESRLSQWATGKSQHITIVSSQLPGHPTISRMPKAPIHWNSASGPNVACEKERW